ncbi:MAG: YdbL family protein [Sphingomonas bacterium]|nr:YdbL family protein [Sphingomonas bacterium]
MKRVVLGLALALALVAGPAAAQDAVMAARGSGVVGERYDGYLGAAGALSSPLRAQVSAINIKRRALYSDLAGRRGVTAQDVGVAAACALLGRVAVGEVYLLTEGQWRRRGPGDAPPRAPYCG